MDLHGASGPCEETRPEGKYERSSVQRGLWWGKSSRLPESRLYNYDIFYIYFNIYIYYFNIYIYIYYIIVPIHKVFLPVFVRLTVEQNTEPGVFLDRQGRRVFHSIFFPSSRWFLVSLVNVMLMKQTITIWSIANKGNPGSSLFSSLTVYPWLILPNLQNHPFAARHMGWYCPGVNQILYLRAARHATARRGGHMA